MRLHTLTVTAFGPFGTTQEVDGVHVRGGLSVGNGECAVLRAAFEDVRVDAGVREVAR
ncbi:hypothetical protein [Streptomyces sp. NPDC006274]|uniref:hypothetical protein n=1 Tax=unclassified Streptomyces TaxID=2593676 RepID=UPI0033B10409